MKNSPKSLSAEQTKALLKSIQLRFEKNKHRHKNIDWETVESKLLANPQKIWSLNQMEITGGEPDLIWYNTKTGVFTFVDCSPESPKDRRSICYDHEALESRKENKPKNSACQMAAQMGIQLLTEEQYRDLQKIEKFDTKTSSWIKTPADVRALGGALFCDYRYGKVFTYHNGAESYYAVRGFRGLLEI